MRFIGGKETPCDSHQGQGGNDADGHDRDAIPTARVNHANLPSMALGSEIPLPRMGDDTPCHKCQQIVGEEKKPDAAPSKRVGSRASATTSDDRRKKSERGEPETSHGNPSRNVEPRPSAAITGLDEFLLLSNPTNFPSAAGHLHTSSVRRSRKNLHGHESMI